MARVRPLRQGGREGDADVRRQQFPGTERVFDFDCLSIAAKFRIENYLTCEINCFIELPRQSQL